MSMLRPLRRDLQTVGLACGRESLGELSAASLFLRAGALRILPIGEMLSGYMGEPHDGVYASSAVFAPGERHRGAGQEHDG